MPSVLRSVLRRRVRVLAGACVATVVGATLVTTPPAVSALGTECPPAFPVGKLAEGQPVHGLTVSKGSTPDEFTGEVVGTLTDGIALGLDLILVKLEGSVITHADGSVDRGIWSGMSGSPVYAEDGRLIGAVSYSLSYAPSEYAGVTPAAEMYRLGSYSGKRLRPAKAVATSPGDVTRLRSLGVPASQANAGFRRLPMPMSVSGLSGNRLRRVAKRMDMNPRALTSGSTARVTDQAAAIVPGGNVAATLSYGDITMGGVGTTTAVCGDRVLAFGHPFAFAGRSRAALHGAEAMYVQRDTLFGSFKVANPSAPVGVFTQDRMAGILGRVGVQAETMTVRSRVRSSEGNRRTGWTHVIDRSWADQIATMHLMSNLDSMADGYAGGTGKLAWTVRMRRANGKHVTFRQANMFSSKSDLTYFMPWQFYFELATIMNNPFERVKVVEIRQRAFLSRRYRQYRVGAVHVRRAGHWAIVRRGGAVRVRPGQTLRIRTRLMPAGGSTIQRRNAHFRFRVPSTVAGRSAEVSIRGSRGLFASVSGRAKSFNGMLRKISRTPTNNTVTAELSVRTRHGVRHMERRAKRPAPIAGSRSFGVVFRRTR